MKNTSSFCSRLLRCCVSLLIVAPLAVFSTNAAPKRRLTLKAKSVPSRTTKRAQTKKKVGRIILKDKPLGEFCVAYSEPPAQLAPPPPSQLSESKKQDVAAKTAELVPPISAASAALKPEDESQSAPSSIEAQPEPVPLELTTNNTLEVFERTLLSSPIQADTNWLEQWNTAPPSRIEITWYTACYTDKDKVACENFSKLLIQNYRDSAYYAHASKFVIRYGMERQFSEFQKALGDYYAANPTEAKLERLFLTGDPLLHLHYVLAQMALAGTAFAVFEPYSDLDRVKLYVEKGLRAFEPAETASTDIQQAQWNEYRRRLSIAGNQFLGFYALYKTNQPEQAVIYLSRAIAVKGHDRQGWKDQGNYWFRTQAAAKLMEAASNKYNALSPERQASAEGQALLTQMQTHRRSQIEDFARIVALKKDEYPKLLSRAQESLRALLHDDPNREQVIQDLIKRFETEFAVG